MVMTDQVAGHITRVEELAYELRIGQVMTRNVQTVTPDTPMRDVSMLFRNTRISGAPVIHNGELVGIISLEDLIRCLFEGDTAVPVRAWMTSQVYTVQEREPVIEALKVFSQTGVGRLPVLDRDGRLAGIITKGDITSGVLRALQQDYQTEEVRRYRASHLFQDVPSDRTSLILRYHIKPRDFDHGGTASSQIKRALVRLGAQPETARRCGIAVYEAEMNLIIHTLNGGDLRVEIEPDMIYMQALDDGPGIEDIQQAMQPGYSTASEEVRKLGFGAGMGLKNIQRCTDEMVLESAPGRGTRLEMRIYVPKTATFGSGKVRE